MPELNNNASDTAVTDTAVPGAAWPELAVPGSRASEAGVADPAVLAILDRVREVPGLPVSEHPAAYADMHDALLEALNEEPQNEEPQNEEPRHGPGAA
ncbi:hypothetical protein QFZ23_001744 [Arthrobacter globiformis]|uniref:hypothetical protein n=1 Tax=Arthrobacter globiformis TaxID=1665 RepID=UPI002783A38C|nr:hypothetical protein [Arthrobacter globiformis]MDQ1057843.1 hypothetical protein [Arthrobacter globiformis]